MFKKTQNVTGIAAGVLANLTLFGLGVKQATNNQKWFENQSPGTQRRVKERCPLSYMSTTGDGFAAVSERMVTPYPGK